MCEFGGWNDAITEHLVGQKRKLRMLLVVAESVCMLCISVGLDNMKGERSRILKDPLAALRMWRSRTLGQPESSEVAAP